MIESVKLLKVYSITKRLLIIVIGLFLLSIGVTCYLKVELGSDAFTVFYDGVSRVLGISVGRALQVSLLLLLIIVAFIDRTRLGIGTLMHATLTGFFIDIIMSWNILIPQNYILRFAILLIGVFLVGSGLAMYIKAGLGVGAVDALMIILHNRLKKDIKWIRIILDASLATLGFVMGGKVGIGTAFGVILTGPVIEHMLKTYTLVGIRMKRMAA